MVQKVMEKAKGGQASDEHQRNVIFISHATPGDNVFATWLAKVDQRLVGRGCLIEKQCGDLVAHLV